MEFNATGAHAPAPHQLGSSYERWVGPEGAFDYTPNAPTRDADELMGKIISRRGESESLVLRRFSQTPLAPELLIDMGISYGPSVAAHLENRVAEAAARVALPEGFTEAAQLEVSHELDRRLQGNSAAAKRLYAEIYGTEALNENDAELIWKARTGDATLAETGQLLLRYPMMRSIEAAKYTEPFSPNIFGNMAAHIRHGLGGFAQQISRPSRLNMHVYRQDDLRRHPHYIPVVDDGRDEQTRALLSCIMATKDTMAEVTDGTTTIQLVRKHTMIMVPPELRLRNALPAIKNVKGNAVSLLPIALSCYWRVPDDSSNTRL